MNIIECNQMIDVFMGSKGEYISYKDVYGGEVWGEYKPHNYHSDWNELMRAVEKINNTGRFEVVIQYGFCYITDANDELTLSFPASNTIYAVYQAVVEFIKWYNEQI